MKIKGVGLAAMMYGLGYGFGRPDFGSAEVELASDGTLTVWNGASELGQGLRTVLCQLAAEELGIRYEDTTIVSSDTAKTGDAGPVSASRSTYVQGNAVINAVRDLKGELSVLARELTGGRPGELEFAEGAVRVKGEPSWWMPLRRLAKEMHARGRRTRGYGRYDITTDDVDPETSQGDAYATFTWASQLALVEVDTETGQVSVLRLASATDTGRTINPAAAEGQIEGGALQGLGFALMEEASTTNGRMLNLGLAGYLIPTAADAPEIDVCFVEVPDPNGPLGAKGIGEPSTIPAAPAIFGAIANATSVRFYQTPVNPARLLSALGETSDAMQVKVDLTRLQYPAS